VKMRKLEALTGPLAPFGAPDAHGNVGESPDVWALRDQLAFAAKSNFHVLLHGESGTGKELAARAIHARSSRAKGPFIACNVTTLSPGLIDGLLWGNKVNYPQAGMAENKGLVGRAHGGTLFLDEIGHLPIELQAKLLRFMDENGEYQPLGDATRYADVRIIAATNRDVSELKHDLLKRLDLHVELPSLDTHPEDVPLLARHILLFAAIDNPELNIERFIRRDGQRPEVAIEPALMLALVQHTYDGNVRELRKVLLRAIATAAADATSLVWSDMLDPEGDVEVAEVYTGSEMTPQETKELIERFQWNVKRAAKFRKMSRSVLTRLIKRHGLVRPRGQ